MTTTRWTFAAVALAVCGVAASALSAGKPPRSEPEDGHVWLAEAVDLGDTGFQATVGPWGTKNPVYYSVGVEKKNSDGSQSVYFEAKLSVAGLPKRFTKKPIKEVVRFSPRTGNMVTFDLGDQQISYMVPSR